MRVSLLVAAAKNGVIGRSGGLPWRLSADLRRFKQLTLGHHIIMGRKTFDSIGRALPGRTSIVVSRQAKLAIPPACLRCHSLNEALRFAEAAGDTEAFVIGGAEIFSLALPLVSRVYLTIVEAQVPGDTFFAPLDPRDWNVLHDERHPADARNEFDYSFRVLERKTQ